MLERIKLLIPKGFIEKPSGIITTNTLPRIIEVNSPKVLDRLVKV
jgi:hypothetical protein